jgi:hypothetical protein
MICKNCHKSQEEHFPDPKFQWIKEPFWCVEMARKIYNEVIFTPELTSKWFNLIIDTMSYKAMDNLDYVEYIAKQKNLV